MNTKASQPVHTPASKDLITIKSAKVLITGKGVEVKMPDRDAVHAAILNPSSNNLKATADKQALAMWVVAMFRIATETGFFAPRILSERRSWWGPMFTVDISTVDAAPAPVLNQFGRIEIPKWNDQSYLASACRWGAHISGIDPSCVGLSRVGLASAKAEGPKSFIWQVVPQQAQD
jgi:hypothetical protein